MEGRGGAGLGEKEFTAETPRRREKEIGSGEARETGGWRCGSLEIESKPEIAEGAEDARDVPAAPRSALR